MSQLQVTGEAKIRDIQGPVVANSGVISALDGAANQYVRGDGALASFPTVTGGGSSVSFYLNGSVNQGTFGGSTYYQLGENAITGVGTNFSTSTNGLLAQFITDANVPDQTEIPSGNWNVEFFMGVSASSGSLASFYVEIYKYDGTTFTLVGTNVATPEFLTNTTTIDAYFTSVAIPLTTLNQTDRIAVRVFANVASKTVTLYTEDNRLCQVVTTFSRGVLSINNLTDQQQYFAVGTSGTNFNIASSGDTHTFNLPVASATNTGKLSNTDWSTFNNKVPYTGATTNVDLGAFNLTASIAAGNSIFALGGGTVGGYIALKQGDATIVNVEDYNNIYANNSKFVLNSNVSLTNYKSASFDLASLTNNTQRTFTLPDLSGTLITDYGNWNFHDNITFENAATFEKGLNLENLSAPTSFDDIYSTLYSVTGSNNLMIRNINSSAKLQFNNSNQTYTFPAASGTVALTSDLGAYVTLATTQTISGLKTFTALATNNEAIGIKLTSGVVSTGGYLTLNAKVVGTLHSLFLAPDSTTNRAEITFDNTALRTYALPNASGTLALTSQLPTYGNITSADSNTMTISGGTGAIIGAGVVLTLLNASATNGGIVSTGTQTFAGAKTFSSSVTAAQLTINGVNDGTAIFAKRTGGANVFALNTNLDGSWTMYDYANGSSYTTGITQKSGNVGIGTSSPATLLHLASSGNTFLTIDAASSSNSGIAFYKSGAGGGAIYYLGASDAMRFDTNATERMRITSSGDVGIGTSTIPYAAANRKVLTVNGGSNGALFGLKVNDVNDAYFYTDGANTYINRTINSGNIYVTAGNSGGGVYLAYTATSWTANSDERLKDINGTIENAVDKLMTLRAVNFSWKSDETNKENLGLIAQDVEKVFPQVIDKNKLPSKPEQEQTDDTEYLGVRYQELVPVLIAAIQEQQAQIEELSNKIVALQSK